MKRINKWLATKGIKGRPIYMGHNNYFYNAPNIRLEGLQLVFNADCIKSYNETITKARTIKNYCKRYGYTLEVDKLQNGIYYIIILTNQDHNALALYNQYYQASTAECNELIHVANVENDFTLCTNEKLKAIMNYWGNKYNAALKAENVA